MDTLNDAKFLISECDCNPKCPTFEGDYPLHCACENGHLGVVKYLITERKCSPECGNDIGCTPLHAVASNGHLAVVKYLISEIGCNPQIADINDFTPLHVACINGHLDIAKYLISECDCNSKCLTHEGDYPLHFACENGHLEVAKYLITEHKCSPECGNETGYSPLHAAARNGHLAVVKYLIREIGCNPQITDINGFTPLHAACLNGHLDIAKFLISECSCNPDTRNPPLQHTCWNNQPKVAKYLITENKSSSVCGSVTGYTTLHVAASSGHLAVVKYLISELGCNPLIADNDGLTPLHYACHLDITKYLISDWNCNPQCTDKDGNTPLRCACENGHLEVAKYLITEHKCRPEHGNDDGYTPLHSAAHKGHQDVLKFLISEVNCNPQIPINDGLTPLHYACMNGQLNITNCLISDYNCNPECLTSRELTPLYYACKNGHLEVAKYLISEHKCRPQHANIDGFTPLHSAASNGHLAVVKYLISEIGCDPQYATCDGYTSLHCACLNGHQDVVKYLILDCNCDPECHTNRKLTPLYYACENGHLQVAKYLITEHKCSPECVNVDGYTPLHSAASNGHLAVVKYLISEFGCNPQIADNDGLTPLHFACMNGHLDVSKGLILDCNCNQQCSANNGNTPLHYACQEGHLETAKYLILEHNCNPEHGNVDDFRPLHSAAINGHLSVLKYLITQHNCNPQCSTVNGVTPLHVACARGQLHVVKYLIQERKCPCEVKCLVKTSVGRMSNLTAIDFALMGGHQEVVSYLRDEHHCSFGFGQAVTSLLSQMSSHLFGQNDCFDSTGIDFNDVRFSPLQLACLSGNLAEVKHRATNSNCHSASGFLGGLTPLHNACSAGHLEIVKYLVTECKCDPNCTVVGTMPYYQNTTHSYLRNGLITPLFMATTSGHVEVVKWLVREQKCEPTCTYCQCECNVPLYNIACQFGHLSVMKYLLSETISQEKEISNLLLSACFFGHFNIVKYLIEEYKCNPHFTDDDGITPLHLACGCIRYFEERKHQICSAANSTFMLNMQSILQIFHGIINSSVTLLSNILPKFVPALFKPAKEHSNSDISSDTKWVNHINRSNEEQASPYNLRCFDVVNYLITEHNCNPQCTDKEGQTPLHYACASGLLEIVQYFHDNKLSDLVHTSNSGDTPLHFACKYDQVEIVQFLLSAGECNPLIKNAEGITPVEFATSPEISEQLDHFCKGKYPLESVVKVFVLGDPSTGKSSLVQGIKTNLGFLGSLLGRFQRVKGVRQQTAGIDSFYCGSTEFGNVIIYDFAGQREFHTSHAAFLQNYSTHMAGIFITVINIALCEDDICQSLQYWMSFVQDCCLHNEIKPHIIIVGSHADQLGDMDFDQAFTVIQQTGFFEHSDDTDQSYELVGIVCLDCTWSASSGMDLLRSYLQQSCDSVRDSTEKIDQRCYVLHRYVFKTYTETDIHGHTLKIISKDLAGNPYLLPCTSVELLPLFQTLHDKGQVVLLENSQEVSDSWVITNIPALLETVVGSIFVPRNFPQHIAPGSTGIVTKSRMSEAFPDLNTEMVIGFLEHFEFCHRVEPEWLGESQSIHQMSDDEYYLFPALLTSENVPQVWRENNESSYCCSWLMYSTVEGRFFTTRFLHALLLQLAFLFAPPQDDATPSSSKIKSAALSCRCNMWENGISWPDANGVKACFELINLKTVILKMTCVEGREIHCVRLRTKLINVIVEAKNKFCPRVNVEECIMEVEAGNFQKVMECPSHSIKYLSSMIADRDPNGDPDLILTHSDGSTGKQISKLLYFDSYVVLSSDLITQLFSTENAKKLMSVTFITKLASHMYPFSDSLEQVLNPDPSIFSEKCKDQVQSLGEKSRRQLKCKHILETWVEQLGPNATYRKLRQELNKYSIFCGRNPLHLVSTIMLVWSLMIE